MVVLKRIAAFLLTLIFLFASGGILLVHTFCSCANIEMASLYAAPEHCSPHLNETGHDTHSTQNACATEDRCCLPSLPETAQHAHHDASNHNCESSSITYLKIENQFLNSEETLFTSLALRVLLTGIPIEQPSKDDVLPVIHNAYILPPKLRSGRELILHHQQFKLPHHA